MARALRVARGEMSQVEFAAALRAVGVPVGGFKQVSDWEIGENPEVVNPRNIVIVPAFVLVGAAKVAGRTVGELLTASGVEGQEPLVDQVAYIRRRQQMIEEALNELRAERGLPPLPVIDEEAVD